MHRVHHDGSLQRLALHDHRLRRSPVKEEDFAFLWGLIVGAAFVLLSQAVWA
jgi:hypothetical protein